MDFIIVNGEIVKKHETGFTPFFWNEPFVITQKIWFGFGGIPLFQENLENLKLVLSMLNVNIPELLCDEQELFRLTKRMLNKNRFFRSGIIVCQVFTGKTETNIIISSIAFPDFDFPISKQGLIINFSDFTKYNGNPQNQFAFFNAPLWKFADAGISGTTFNNSIFFNEKGNICDCIAANIFLIKGKILLTPAIETGCYNDTLRNHILMIAPKANLKVIESDEIKKADVNQMNEIFIAGEEHGIQWVLGVGNKRFVHHYSEIIHEQINAILKKKVK
ncbi:MAG: aminotransferase class IV [Draconibacterium sp.]|nr:aminotransferase class IV [Draconibacterium sp.]